MKRSISAFFGVLLLTLGIATQAQAADSYVGVWNGFLNHNEVAEINNLDGKPVDIHFTLYNFLGEILGQRTFTIQGKGSFHIPINRVEFDGTVDSYGTYEIKAAKGQGSDLNLTGLTVFYRNAPLGSRKPVDYAFAIPFYEPLKGATAGIYNSFNPDSTAFASGQPVYNWLSIFLPPGAPKAFKATVEVYDGAGALLPGETFSVTINPGQRGDYPLGHETGQVTGIYRIIPNDGAQEYGAFLNRYYQSAPGEYRFAFSLASLPGSCDPGPVPASTMNPATNWGEVANVTASAQPIYVEVKNQQSTLLFSEDRVLAPFSQQHYQINSIPGFGDSNLGTFYARCKDPKGTGKLIVQSMYYGHLLPETKPAIEWAYGSQAKGLKALKGDIVTSTANTFLGAWNFYKIANISGPGGAAATTSVSVFDLNGAPLVEGQSSAIAAGGTVDLFLHDLIGFDVYGLLTQEVASSSTPVSSELIRVFQYQLPDGHIPPTTIGYIMNVPTTIVRGEGDPALPLLKIEPKNIAFGSFQVNQAAGDQTITLTNEGSLPLSINSITLSGTHSGDFSYSGPATASIAPGASLKVKVGFTPTAFNNRNATLAIVSNSQTSPDTIALTGTGVSAALRINSGGPAFTDAQGRSWLADTDSSRSFSVGGKPFSVNSNKVITGVNDSATGTSAEQLYETERFNDPAGTPLRYEIPVSNGSHFVTLHFAEIFFSAAGERVFSVKAEGVTVVASLDMVFQKGLYGAFTRSFRTTVNDGALTLEFVSLTENAKLSGIEVVSDVGQSVPGYLTVLPTSKSFGTFAIGANSPQESFTLRNDGGTSFNVEQLSITGAHKGDFTLTAPTLPLALQPGKSTTVGIVFSPTTNGPRVAELSVASTLSATPLKAALNGTGPSDAIRINCGGDHYTDTAGNDWVADTSFAEVSGTAVESVGGAISRSEDDLLYQTERFKKNGGILSYNVPLANDTYTVRVHLAETFYGLPNKRVFNVVAEGQLAVEAVDIYSEVGAFAALVKQFDVVVSDGKLDLDFVPSIENAKCSAIEILSHSEAHGDPFLHTVIRAPKYVVDYDGNGVEDVLLNGSDSHTHQPGQGLVDYVWKDGATVIGTQPIITVPLALGLHQISLTIFDGNVPPRSLAESATLGVFPIDEVPGVVAEYYPAGAVSLSELIGALQEEPSFIETLPNFSVERTGGSIGGSPFDSNTVVALIGRLEAPVQGSYKFQLLGGAGGLSKLFVNGTEVPLTGAPGLLQSGNVTLNAGFNDVEARFPIDSLAALKATVFVQAPGESGFSALEDGEVTHDETVQLPFINTMPSTGAALGGESITITGFGFFPADQVGVLWDGAPLPSSQVTVMNPTELEVITPAGTDAVTVQIQTPQGVSNQQVFSYNDSVPVAFSTPVGVLNSLQNADKFPFQPTAINWGPDGRLYVGGVDGTITAIRFNDDYTVNHADTVKFSPLPEGRSILGLTFNPFDDPNGPLRVYVGHSTLFAHFGGSCGPIPDGNEVQEFSPYNGKVSVVQIQGNTVAGVTDLITNLPVSNHDHGINALEFDDYGDLLIAVGSNTNAGVQHCQIGGLPESPLSAAILKAETSKPDFNGTVTYVARFGETVSDVTDQREGDLVVVAPGVDVSVFAAGFRNPFDFVWTTRSQLYSTDNGANDSFGPQPPPGSGKATSIDQLEIVFGNHYYGSPNLNRGVTDPRQNVYKDADFAPHQSGIYSEQLALFDSSTNGIAEYRATTFDSAMRGELLVQKWKGQLFRVRLSTDGRVVENVLPITNGPNALIVRQGPGGAIIASELFDCTFFDDMGKPNQSCFAKQRISVTKPINVAAPATGAYDIFPWRGTAGTPFVIGGVGFSGPTTVKIGSLNAAVTDVTPTRIRGVIPANGSPTAELLDVVVTSNGVPSTLPKAFRYLFPAGTGKGTWESGPDLPEELEEVAGGVINGVLYLVGGGETEAAQEAVFRFDLVKGVWTALADRPFPGHHHAAEVIDGRLYLFGGFEHDGGNTAVRKKVQIYDPLTNSWSLGADLPAGAFPNGTGSASSALINGVVFLAGGIDKVLDQTLATLAKYDPANDSWTVIPNPMPLTPEEQASAQQRGGRNHAAAASDGKRFFIFGGRGPLSGDNNDPQEGFADVYIYDPATNTWETSFDAGSTIPPLPQKRGGMGKAVFFNGEFYVMGGETRGMATTVPNNVYKRVDVYNPATKTWRLDADMPTARHGIFPLVHDNRIYVAGGGIKNGHSHSKVFEIFHR